MRFRVFGTLRLEGAEARGADGEIRSTKALVLLAYLTVEGPRPIARSRLADVFWGDERPETARSSLRQALHTIRKALGPEAITADRRAVALRPSAVQSDYGLAEQAFARNDAAELLRLCSAPFCAGVEFDRVGALARWVGAIRTRWRVRVRDVVIRRTTHLLAAGELNEAVDLARNLAEIDEALEGVVEHVADVLVAAGEVAEARDLLERTADRLTLAELPVPAGMSRRLGALGRLDGQTLGPERRPPRDATVRSQTVPDHQPSPLIGRIGALRRLAEIVDEVRSGTSRRLWIVGPAGIGKTRLLGEAESIGRHRTLRIARVRYLPPMAQSAWSAWAELVRTLAQMPGAIGVEERTAGALVDAVPELRASFPNAIAVGGATGRGRDALLADLLDAVADGRALAILQDDVQWMDEASQNSLDDALKLVGAPVLDLRATRDSADRLSSGSDVIALAPLSADDIQRWLAPTLHGEAPAQLSVISESLREATGGIPQWVSLELRRWFDEGLLRRESGRWVLSAQAGASVGVGLSAALDDRIARLETPAREALRVASMWRRPMEDGDLIGVLRLLDPRRETSDWRRALSGLERAGFLMLQGNAWIVGHELVAEATLRSAERPERIAVLLALSAAFLGDGARALPRLEYLAQLCGQQDAVEALELLVRRAARHASLRALGVRGPSLAARAAAAAGRPEWEGRLRRALGPIERQAPLVQMGLAAVGAVAGTAMLWLMAMLQPRLRVEVTPIAGPTARGPGQPIGIGFYVQPRLGLYDGFGRRLRAAEGDVRVESSMGRVSGDAVRSLSAGRAQFESLVIEVTTAEREATSLWTLRFASHWWVRAVTVVPLGQTQASPDRFRLIRVVVDGDTVSPDGEVVLRSPGDSLTVEATFEFTASNPTANYVVGAAPTWGDPARSVVRLAGLPRPVVDVWQTVTFRVAAPSDPSRQAIVFAMDVEGSVEHVFSQTNWAAGEPVWGDGNDLVSLPSSRLEQLRRDGHVASAGMLFRRYRTPLGMLGGRPAQTEGVPPSATAGPARPLPKGYVPKDVLGGVVWVRGRD